MKIGYARVSTDDQNPDLQIAALKKAGCRKICEDRGIIGISSKRSGLTECLAALKENDVLVVWKLDRLGRSLPDLVRLLDDFRGKKIGFRSLTESIDTTTAAGELFFHMVASFAHFERSLIAERTKAGMKAAKRRGKHIGRPRKLTDHQLSHARLLIGKEKKTSRGRRAARR
ncbi:MAG: recombinase family protein [Gammaproteobacteria bacterium]